MSLISGDLVDSREAADILGLTPSTVHWLARRGAITKIRRDGRHWFDRASVKREAERRAGENARWITYTEAANIVGCARGTITKAVARGDITHRTAPNRDVGGPASLDRDSVQAFARQWTRSTEETQREAAQRLEAQAARAALWQPPKDGQVWLDVTTTAIVLALSDSRVKQFAAEDRIPHRRQGRRLWFRRSDVEQMAAARSFADRRRHARAQLSS